MIKITPTVTNPWQLTKTVACDAVAAIGVQGNAEVPRRISLGETVTGLSSPSEASYSRRVEPITSQSPTELQTRSTVR